MAAITCRSGRLRPATLAAHLVLLIVACSALSPREACAERVFGHGTDYVFTGFGSLSYMGARDGTWQVGGGVERLVWKGFGIGAEMQYFAVVEDLRHGVWIGTFSAVHHYPRTGRTYSILLFGATIRQAFSEPDDPIDNHSLCLGTGISHQIGNKLRVRLEGRDNLIPHRGSWIHHVEVRIGFELGAQTN